MVNGYAVIPDYIVETINSSNVPVQTIKDPKVIKDMDELVFLGKPLYVEGVKVGDYTIKAQLPAATHDGGWTVAYSLNVGGALNLSLFFAISHVYSDNQIVVLKGY